MGRSCWCWIKMIHFLPLSFLQFHRNNLLSTSINLCISWGFLLNLCYVFFLCLKKRVKTTFGHPIMTKKHRHGDFKWLRISLFSSCKNLIVCFQDFTLFTKGQLMRGSELKSKRKKETINVLEGIMVSWFCLYKSRNRIKYDYR